MLKYRQVEMHTRHFSYTLIKLNFDQMQFIKMSCICFPVALILTHHIDLTEVDPVNPLTKLPAPAAADPPGEYRKRSTGPSTAGTRSTETRM